MDGRRLANSAILVVLGFLAAALFLSGQALANPSPPPRYGFLVFEIIGIAVVINLPSNLAVMELVVYVCLKKRGTEIFRREVPDRLIRRMVFSCVLVSIIGTYLDLWFLFGSSDEMTFHAGMWSIALSLILVSVIVPMFFLVRTKLSIAALSGFVDVAVNAFFWLIFMALSEANQGYALGFSMFLGGLIFSFVLAKAIWDWFDKKSGSDLKEL